MTKGFFTSEFWLNLGSFLGGLFLLVYGAVTHDKELVSWGVALAAGTSVPYAGIRAFVKVRTNAIAEPPPSPINSQFTEELQHALKESSNAK